jgi:twinkle protein
VPKVWKKPQYQVSDPRDKTLDWFLVRGIPGSVVLRNKITTGKVWMPQVEAEVDCIRFPFIRNGEVVNIKSRDAKKNFRQESGAERIFYGMDDVTGSTMIIVEGEIDKLSLEVAGFLNTVSVPDGAPSPKAKDYTSKFDFLENCEEWLEKIETIILAVDADDPGQVLQEELARRLGKDRCKLVQWPEGCKDANEVLVTHGSEMLRDKISQARHYPVEGIFEITDLQKQILNLYRDGSEGGLSPGWPSVKELYTVRPGEWTLITGIPGHGKSEFLDAILVNLMWSNWRFAIFSPENQPLQLHVAKLMEKVAGLPFHRGVTKRMDENSVKEGMGLLNNVFTFILPPEDEITIDGILSRAKTLVLRKGIKGLVIDPWNELDHKRSGFLTETEYISQALSKVRRFARAYGIHIWLVVHPTKLQKNAEGDYPVPTPYDCQGSAHWRNKADNCIAVYRNMKNDDVEIHVQKIRFKEVGKVGMVPLKYDKVTGRYSDGKS